MRDLFPGHYGLRTEEIKALWDNCIFVPDANVLLNLYRYSPKTKIALIRVIRSLNKRIWIPYQVASEFFNNRINVIDKQIDAYDEAIKIANNLVETLQSSRRHPFVSSTILNQTENSLERLVRDLQQRSDNQEKLLLDDPDLETISELFGDCVGAEPSEDEYTSLLKIAEERINNKVPPGYKDQSKDGPKKCGDAILWLQTLEFAEKKKKPIVLITDDVKEDWWLTKRGKILGPRPELVKEFTAKVKSSFYLYQPARFLEYANEYLGEETDMSVVEEVKLLTEDRARRRHARQIDPVSYVEDIGDHIGRHLSELTEYVRIIESVEPEVWHKADHPLKLPAGIFNKLKRVCTRCPCVTRISQQISAMTPPGYHAIADEIPHLMTRKCADTFVRIRHLPDEAIEMSAALTKSRGSRKRS